MSNMPQNYSNNNTQIPQPIRDGVGGTDPGPRNIPLDLQNPDVLTPPPTDAGTIANMKFSFSMAHNRLQDGGWARQVTVRELPIATTMAGVNMRLNPGAVRELHWHKEAEWSYMLNGRARVTAIDQFGNNFLDDVGVGDLWNFPAGIPHSIQALEEGCEFLLVFDDGNFSEDSTFLLTDWLAHTPKSIIAKNVGVPESALADIPTHDINRLRYIFPVPIPGPMQADKVADPNAPQGQLNYTYRMHEQEPIHTPGGQVRIVDSHNFPASSTIASALVEVNPGGMRELHWHPNNDEWQYYIEGKGRMTVFASEGKARTFDYQAGDVGYVPFAMGHYIENVGDTPLRFLEMFKSSYFADISLNQWLALTPPELVQAHLNLKDQTLQAFSKQKKIIVQ